MPKIWNKRDPNRPSGAIYIGRPSVFGNPFKIGPDGSREEVIEKYRHFILSRPDLLALLPTIRGQDLVCWCTPLPCHGDILLELANKES